METAIFTLENYIFDKIELDVQNINIGDTISLSFNPFGTYTSKNGVFELCFTFKALVQSKEKPIVHVSCNAKFKFKNNLDFNDLPPFFFSNSIAILFPYIRAMVSTLTLQANIPPIVLPTMNLTSLSQQLKSNTTIRE
jgi:preprotein translocase subunit SecB